MADIRHIPLIFEEILDNVRAIYDETNDTLPIFEFGTYLELTKVHALNDENEDVKYPLVWLVWEANESERNYQGNLIALVRPRIFICNFTDENYKSKERFQLNFVNILYPLWDLIVQEMNKHSQIGMFNREDYQDFDHLYWGSTLDYNKKQNVLFDTLDALEVKFKNEIRILPPRC